MASIRPATLDDVSAIVAMGERFVAASSYRQTLTPNPEQFAAFASMVITHPTGVILLLEDAGGAVVGMLGVLLVPHYYSADPIAQELVWWVEPDARGHGGQLLDAAERWAKQHGAMAVNMVAPSSAVGRLYERRGYRFVESAYQKTWSAPPPV